MLPKYLTFCFGLKIKLPFLHTHYTSFWQVTLPFLVLQGENDVVTDPRISKTLYEEANSIDKTMKLYSGMCHAIATGETDENVALVFADIIAWLDQRACCQEN